MLFDLNIHTLDITGCKQFTDKIFDKLINIHTLDIRGCNQFSDETIKKLNNICVYLIR